jgi:small subunit ribosomal protein S9
MAEQHYYGTGRRKSSSARVYLRRGQGQIKVNNQDLDKYFSRETSRMLVRQPLEATELVSQFDILATVTA